MASRQPEVEIGYLEKSDSYKLESRFFPSKVGGKPAWLDLEQISLDLACGVCEKSCVFLCQLYAPLLDDDDAYHRTIYVFLCRNPRCCLSKKADNFKVFRCQLPRKNKYYVDEEPNDLPEWHPESSIERFGPVCFICGCFGRYSCGKCKSVTYCSKDHQTLHWKSGHGILCGNEERENHVSNFLFPEYEILTEPEAKEDLEGLESGEMPEKSNEEKMKEFEKFVEESESERSSFEVQDSSLEILEKFACGKEDKFLKNYKAKLRLCPDQVVRYNIGGQPLWVAEPSSGEGDIPPCGLCQSPRQFEFQILSTLLSYLNVDSLEESIDWGTLLVYTCKQNCNTGPAYKEEFLLKQSI